MRPSHVQDWLALDRRGTHRRSYRSTDTRHARCWLSNTDLSLVCFMEYRYSYIAALGERELLQAIFRDVVISAEIYECTEWFKVDGKRVIPRLRDEVKFPLWMAFRRLANFASTEYESRT